MGWLGSFWQEWFYGVGASCSSEADNRAETADITLRRSLFIYLFSFGNFALMLKCMQHFVFLKEQKKICYQAESLRQDNRVWTLSSLS